MSEPADHWTIRANRELGPSIGEYLGRSIPAYFIDSRGLRFDYDRIAKVTDGGCELSQIADDEAILSPGLIYRFTPTPSGGAE